MSNLPLPPSATRPTDFASPAWQAWFRQLHGVSNTSIPPAAANSVYAGPTSGGSAIPAFRYLVNADMPPEVLSLSTLIWLNMGL